MTKKKLPKVLVVGSISYDIVFNVFNTFSDEVVVKDNSIKSFSMMLTANNKEMYYGGTAGNIAYGLGLLGAKPMIFSVVGGEFKNDYKGHMENVGISLKVVEKPNEFTANFYAVSDQKKDQIGIFQPNTHGDYMDKISLNDTISSQELQQVKVAIFSPGTGKSIQKHMSELRKICGRAPLVIFDPSQVLSIFFTKESLIKCLKLSDIFIGNETEIDQLQKLLSLQIPEIFQYGLKYIIETKGSKGCVIYTQTNTPQKIPALKVKNFVEQTGAGDAFRSGMIFKLLQDESIIPACKFGTEIAAKSVQSHGGQNYVI